MKLKIDNEALAEEFFEESILLGIVAPVKDYMLCWHLNNVLGFNFRINTDLEIQLTKKKRTYFFSVFEYRLSAVALTHYLYNNQFDGEYLLPEFKHLDFLWLIKGDFDSKDIAPLIQSIKSLTGVQLVVEMTNEKIKNKQHLIL
ncbi:IPExxxVDY family protein [Ferruginibacter sp. SUN002]|uniref:IPExxxVDY family protein n=1 Tax=Ferruginibacter sp. SUN002 TaxID=2937789 RepID=UPI003D36C68D